jgi:hypothetical protein
LFRLPERNTLCPRRECCIDVCMAPFKPELNLVSPAVCLAFYCSRPWQLHCDPGLDKWPLGWLNPYIIGHYRLEVASDVFNSVGTPVIVVLPHCAQSVAWRCAVGSPCTVAVPGEWSVVLVLHYSRMSARLTGIDCGAYLHVL